VQVIYCPLRVAFPLAKDRQGAKVRYPIPLVSFGAVGETVDLFSGVLLLLGNSITAPPGIGTGPRRAPPPILLEFLRSKPLALALQFCRLLIRDDALTTP
jgi:hypothetical protein